MSWHALIIFKIYIIETKLDFFLLKIKFFKDNGNLLANVTFSFKTLIPCNVVALYSNKRVL